MTKLRLMAAELRPHSVTAIAITPGFLRIDTMLERFGVTERNWRDGGKKDKKVDRQPSPDRRYRRWCSSHVLSTVLPTVN